jgi:phenylacetate-CoA ligase
MEMRRYGGEYARSEREVLARDAWPPEAVSALARERLQRIIRHAAATVPYYARLFATLHLDPADIRSPEDLRCLPTLSKQTIQDNLQAFCSRDAARMQCTVAHTSGTTGAGMRFPLSLAAEREQWAVVWRYRARFGFSHETWYAHFFGKSVVPRNQAAPPFWRVNQPGRQILFSAYHLREDYLPYYVDELNRRRPPVIQGYPSLLSVLADFMTQTGRTLTYEPKVIMASSETLLPHQQNIIERAFGVPCRQLYGQSEAVASISECPLGRLHVDEDFGLLEFQPLEGGGHQLIATGYANFAFPLIRYELGDVVDLELPRECPCGLPGTLVDRIDGRIEDNVLTPDGRKVGRLDHLFKDMINVRGCQIVQRRTDELLFRIIPGKGFSPDDLSALIRQVRRRLGAEIGLKCEFVAELPRTRRGKVRFVVSEINAGRISGFAAEREPISH